jgi:hypothetical protein
MKLFWIFALSLIFASTSLFGQVPPDDESQDCCPMVYINHIIGDFYTGELSFGLNWCGVKCGQGVDVWYGIYVQSYGGPWVEVTSGSWAVEDKNKTKDFIFPVCTDLCINAGIECLGCGKENYTEVQLHFGQEFAENTPLNKAFILPCLLSK